MPIVAWIWLDRQRRRKRFDKAQRIYTDAGLVGSAEKDVVNSEVAKVVGAELDSSIENQIFGFDHTGAPAKKRLALSFLSLELSRLPVISDALHASLIGFLHDASPADVHL